jgi:aryl-alcohol dehydrogenase-like predicted oxidoreductase
MNQIALGTQGLRVPAIGSSCKFWDTSDIYGPFTNELLIAKAL